MFNLSVQQIAIAIFPVSLNTIVLNNNKDKFINIFKNFIANVCFKIKKIDMACMHGPSKIQLIVKLGNIHTLTKMLFHAVAIINFDIYCVMFFII